MLCPAILACNQVLGIDAPEEAPLVSAMETPPVSTARDAELEDPSGQTGQEPSGEHGALSDPREVSPHAWAAWPMPHPPSLSGAANPQSFQHTPEFVIDSVTKLKWQKVADKTLRTRDEAERFCADLRLKGESLRLPSRIELLSLVDFTRAGSYLDEDAFPNERAGKYWTASGYARDASRGWVVNFEFGTTLVGIEVLNKKCLVRCVR